MTARGDQLLQQFRHCLRSRHCSGSNRHEKVARVSRWPDAGVEWRVVVRQLADEKIRRTTVAQLAIVFLSLAAMVSEISGAARRT